MALEKEDTKRRKIVRHLTIEEGSAVDEGGNQYAAVKIVRDNEPPPPPKEKPMSFIEKLFSFNRNSDYKPSTMMEIKKYDKMMQEMAEAENYLYRSMYQILDGTKGKEQAEYLRRTVTEFGEEMNRIVGDDDETKLSRELIERGRHNTGKITDLLNVLDDSTPDSELSTAKMEQLERALNAFKPNENDVDDDVSQKGTNVNPEELQRALTDLSPEDRAAFLSAANLTEAKTNEVDLDRSADSDEPKVEDAPKAEDDTRLEALERSISTLTEGMATLTAQLSEKNETVEIERMAQSLEGVPGQTRESLVEILTAMPAEGREAFCRSMSGLKAQMDLARSNDGNSIFSETGAHFPAAASGTDIMTKVDRAVSEVRKDDPTITTTVARARVWKLKPELRAEYEAVNKPRA